AETAIAVSALERALAQGQAPEEELKAMQDLLRQEMDVPILLRGVRGERAGFDAFIEAAHRGKVKLSGLAGPRTGSVEDWIIETFPIILTHGRPSYLRLMNKTVEAAKLPPEKQGEAIEAIENEVRATKTPIVRLLMPAINKVSEAYRRN